MSLLDHTFGGEYELALSAWGEGTLEEGALLDLQKPEEILRAFRRKYRRDPKEISLLVMDSRTAGCGGYTAVDPAFLEKLPTLKELILPDSVTRIDLTPALLAILEKNDPLIRGVFDSFAERFAAEHGLRFRPADFTFASFENEYRESTDLSLVFRRNGTALIREVNTSPGSSAGNTFGGSFTHPLPADFDRTKTASQIAETLGARAEREILRDGRLAAFLEKAKTHDYYRGRN